MIEHEARPRATPTRPAVVADAGRARSKTLKIEPSPQDFDADEFAELGAERVLACALEHFDAGRYEEAHEDFEKLWLANESSDADFFKGLIQAAICLHHFQRGNLEGARKLYSGHRRYLAPFAPAHRGLDVERLLTDMAGFLRPCLRARPDEPVPFELAAAPRMHPRA